MYLYSCLIDSQSFNKHFLLSSGDLKKSYCFSKEANTTHDIHLPLWFISSSQQETCGSTQGKSAERHRHTVLCTTIHIKKISKFAWEEYIAPTTKFPTMDEHYLPIDGAQAFWNLSILANDKFVSIFIFQSRHPNKCEMMLPFKFILAVCLP